MEATTSALVEQVISRPDLGSDSHTDATRFQVGIIERTVVRLLGNVQVSF
jgi:hypothetical protein